MWFIKFKLCSLVLCFHGYDTMLNVISYKIFMKFDWVMKFQVKWHITHFMSSSLTHVVHEMCDVSQPQCYCVVCCNHNVIFIQHEKNPWLYYMVIWILKGLIGNDICQMFLLEHLFFNSLFFINNIMTCNIFSNTTKFSKNRLIIHSKSTHFQKSWTIQVCPYLEHNWSKFNNNDIRK